MRRVHWIARGLVNTIRRSRLESETQDELTFHIDSRANDLIQAGIRPDEARRRARIEFGGIQNYREQHREARGIRPLDDLGHDLTYAWRSLRRTPALAVTAIAAVAIGVTINTALVSLIYAAILRPLPISDPGSVRRVSMQTRGEGERNIRGPQDHVSAEEFAYMRAHAQSVELAALSEATVSCKCVSTGQLNAQLVSGDLLSVIGATPRLGRFFTPEETEFPGSAPVVVLSWATWSREFSANADVIGRSIMMNRTPFTVVGVADERTVGPQVTKADVWIPYTMYGVTRPQERPFENSNAAWLQMFAKRRPGVDDRMVRAELETLGQASLTSHAPRRTAIVTVSPAAFLNYASMMPVAIPVLTLVVVAVSLVLLIACANVANLLLARGFSQRREIAIRVAIGAGRARLFRQFLTESALLGLIAGALGLLLSQVLARVVLAQLTPLTGALQLELTPDWRVVLYTMMLSFVASAAFGVLPALRLLRTDAMAAMKVADTEVTLKGRRFPLQHVLVAIQAGVTMLLMVNGGLFLRAFDRAIRMDLGQAADHVIIASFDLRQQQYTPEQAAQLLGTLRDRSRGWPGAQRVALTNLDPILAVRRSSVATVDSEHHVSDRIRVTTENVSDGYFDTMKISLLRGRDFGQADVRDGGSKVVIVDEQFAKRFLTSADPLGQRVRIQTVSENDHEVIGVVSSTRGLNLATAVGEGALAKVYLPLVAGNYLGAVLAVNYAGTPDAVADALRRDVSEMDLNVNVSTKLIEDNVATTLTPLRLAATATTLLGCAALVLACTGIFGVVSFMLSRRRHELGIRAALGATPGDVVRFMLVRGLRPVLVGAAGGLVLGAASARLIRSLLFGLSPLDPLSFAATLIVLIASAMFATLVPIRLALRANPITALRCD